MNPFFDWPLSVTRFAPYTLARAEDINSTLDLVSYGFDLVAPKASPTFTGDPRSVTPAAANDSTTRIATTEWVQNMIGTLSATTLPTQAGNAGKGLITNGTNVLWAPVGALNYLGKTATASIGAADASNLIDCSGTFTVTFDAPATLGAGWQAVIRNSGTGDITISHTSGNIDGLTSYVLYPGASRLVQCDGTTLRTIPLTGGSRTWASSGTYIMPPGLRGVAARCIGAGAGGQSVFNNSGGVDVAGGRGGGGGECVEAFLTQIAAGTSVTVTVPGTAAGGAALTATGSNAGADGGYASFGSYLKAYGGQQNRFGGGLSGPASVTYSYGRFYESVGTSYVFSDGAGGLGGDGAASNSTTRAGSRSLRGGGGGGAGKSIGTGAGNGVGSQAAGAGGASGEAAGATSTRSGFGGAAGTTGAGTAGANPVDSFAGSGGGGGGTNAGDGFAGGNGAVPGGGGGGGGAGSSTTSGKGGDGGRGEVTVSEVI